jgi:hypothetical protein
MGDKICVEASFVKLGAAVLAAKYASRFLFGLELWPATCYSCAAGFSETLVQDQLSMSHDIYGQTLTR